MASRNPAPMSARREISVRELRENFFPPFRAVVERTAIGAVMPSYNEIDGVPSHANRWLLHDVLRGEWGFDGIVVERLWRGRGARPTSTMSRPTATRRRGLRWRLASIACCPTASPIAALADQVRKAGRSAEAAIDTRRRAPAHLQVPRRPVRESLRRCRARREDHRQRRGPRAGARGGAQEPVPAEQ